MISYLRLSIQNFLSSDDERTSLIRKNIFLISLLKVGTVSITFLLLPLTIHYVSPVRYGIWLTIASIINWFNIFDIGIANGLKNQIAVSIATKEEKSIKNFVSTAYAIFFIIAAAIFILLICLNPFFNWNKILNVPSNVTDNIGLIVVIVIAAFCVQFVLQLIHAILSATQQIFKSTLLSFLSQLAALIIIYLLTLFAPANLTILVLVLAFAPTAISFFGSVYLFNNELKRFAPSFKNIDFKYVNKLLNLGSVFFLIQIGAMILIHSNNLIIARVIGPEAVTVYNIAFQLFAFISMLFAIVIMPYWSAFTDAYAKNDFEWIKKSIRKLRMIWAILSTLGIVILIFSKYLYKFWVRDAVYVPVALSMSMLVYVICYIWHTLHVYFLNGVGKVRVQLYLVLLAVASNIPMAIFLGHKFGLPGIVCTNAMTFLWCGVVYTIQYKKIVSQKATGIWNK